MSADTGRSVSRSRVRTYQLRWWCNEDECTGEMLDTGAYLASNPPWHIHRCNGCGREDKVLDKSYPRVEYET